jgi:hypothetical protein
MTAISDFQTRINRINRAPVRTGIPADMERHRSSHALMRKLRKASRRTGRPGLFSRFAGGVLSPGMMVAVVWLAVGDDVQRTMPDDLRAPASLTLLSDRMMDRLQSADLGELFDARHLVRTYASLTD